MKTAIALSAIAFGAALTLQGAAASDKAHETALTAQSQATDISAHRKRYRAYVYPRHYGYYGYRGAYAADPSWQSPELRRLRALNRCVFDLGYGRWENCN
jgi:hypothetical protein